MIPHSLCGFAAEKRGQANRTCGRQSEEREKCLWGEVIKEKMKRGREKKSTSSLCWQQFKKGVGPGAEMAVAGTTAKHTMPFGETARLSDRWGWVRLVFRGVRGWGGGG